VVLDPVHGIAAEAKSSDFCPVRTSQVMRSYLLGDTEITADIPHRPIKTGDCPAEHEPGRLAVHEQGLDGSWQPHLMVLGVFRTRPFAFDWLSRHFPPAIDDMFGAHMPDLARTLAGQENEFEGRSHWTGLFECRPELCDLTIVEGALATTDLVALDVTEGIFLHTVDPLPDRPGEDRRACHQGLVGDHRSLDRSHRPRAIVVGNAGGLQLAKVREQMLAREVVGLLPTLLVVLLGVLLEVALRQLLEGAGAALGTSRRLWVVIAIDLDRSSRARMRASAKPQAEASPMWYHLTRR
jgi:hypothetical protein